MTLSEFYNADAFDIAMICEHIDMSDRDAQERTRMIMWAMLAPNSKKKITPEDIIQFPWEKKQTDSSPTTKEDFDKAFKKYLKQKENE